MGVFVGLGSSKFFGSIPACLDALVGTDDSRGHRGGTAVSLKDECVELCCIT
jgi:hypothetical protein